MIAVFSILLKDKMSPGYKAEILYDKPVPVNVLKLWIERGYDPIETGVAHVQYPGNDKKYGICLAIDKWFYRCYLYFKHTS